MLKFYSNLKIPKIKRDGAEEPSQMIITQIEIKHINLSNAYKIKRNCFYPFYFYLFLVVPLYVAPSQMVHFLYSNSFCDFAVPIRL